MRSEQICVFEQGVVSRGVMVAVLGVPGMAVETELIISKAIIGNDFIPRHISIHIMSLFPHFQRLTQLSGPAADSNYSKSFPQIPMPNNRLSS